MPVDRICVGLHQSLGALEPEDRAEIWVRSDQGTILLHARLLLEMSVAGLVWRALILIAGDEAFGELAGQPGELALGSS
jgi:hypothetical protein